MPRVTVNVDEETEAWLEEEADRLNWSKADAGGECINLIQSAVGNIDVQQSDVLQSESDDSRLRERVDELEQRVAMLEEGKIEEIRAETGVEPASDTATNSEAAEGGAEAVAGEDNRDPSPDGSSGRGEAPDAADDVRERVAEIAEGWADDDRLDDRIDAAVAAVATARERGSLGKSEAVDELEPKFPVRGQDGETWWRKNVRPVLRELGTYDSGSHGYRVEMD